MKIKGVKKICATKDFEELHPDTNLAKYMRENPDHFIEDDETGERYLFLGWENYKKATLTKR